MKLSDINIRDPFVLVEDGKYYMYGSRGFDQVGFDVYVSSDLENWSEPKPVFERTEGFWGVKEFWAPEVHKFGGKYYMFATFKPEEGPRGTGILVCDTPDGTFTDWSNGKVTPDDWSALDGTFYVENGVPYMIFCHEWIQIQDGTVCAMKLTDDLKKADGEPFVLWHASNASWVRSVKGENNFVTDGPFVVKHNGKLCCIWASFVKDGGYCEGIAYSDNGKIDGKWSVSDNLVFKDDGGHGMCFKTLDDKEYFIFHKPNNPSKAERPVLIPLTVKEIAEKCC
ncbi:MAG: family 43 glycosylhydrolase [Clostridia bacterium]|nr:family 43 glycosylhydrolase [Clostridia bacterium]